MEEGEMRIGTIAPHIGPSLSVARLVEACGRAESLGVDVTWFGDHIVFPYNYESVYPYGTKDGFTPQNPQEVWEALSVMSYVAACTTKILLGTGVLILPYRHPLYTAKTVATIDVLSGGRVLFGAGVGWLEEEFQALDAPEFRERGAVADEQLEIIRAAWTQARPEFHGRYYDFPAVSATPKPIQSPHPPILVGGNSLPAMRRAARFADYWHSIMLLPDEMEHAVERLRQVCASEGREGAVAVSILILIRLTRDPEMRDRQSVDQQRTTILGTPDQVIDALRSYRDAGVELLQTSVTHDGTFAIGDNALEIFMNDVWPAVR
jgi:probable F420-dependent oxidoreductase